jgi:LPS export ABC transporter protein LptC
MHQDRRRRALLGCGLLAASVLFVGACQEPLGGPGGATSEMEGLAAPIAYGMYAFMSATGVRAGRILADTAYTFADSSTVDLRDMTAVFYDENGDDRATVTGRLGEWDQDTDRVFASGDVVLVVHTDGSTIETAELNYDPSIDRVWSDSATVRTLADGTVTRGSSFESDLAFENIDVRDPRGAAGRRPPLDDLMKSGAV